MDFSSNVYSDPQFKFTDQSLKDAVDQNDADAVEFFRLLALCHTVMVEEKVNEAAKSNKNDEATRNPDQVGKIK